MSLGLLVLRVVVGVLFMGHGAQKLLGSFGGGGIEGTASTFEKTGLRPGRVHAWAAGSAELWGGLLLALGLLAPFAAAALIAVMTAAIVTVHGRNGVWVTEQGFEYNAVLIAAAFAVAAVGAGSWSLDAVLGIGDAGAIWGLCALLVGVLGGCAAVLSGRVEHGRRPERRPGSPGVGRA
ncbi:MAG TPA: DoxX family membrane protein [Solirubrobacterales bacterium]